MSLIIQTPARLHLGQLDLNGSLGRKFGGIGVAVEEPNVKLEILPDDCLSVEGEKSEHVRMLAERFFDHFKLPQKVKIRVLSTIPAHVGLGSGTQLRLALAEGLARHYGLEASIYSLAAAMNRGESRSGIGIAAFVQGGFIVDGGIKLGFFPGQDKVVSPPPLLFRHNFPDDWFSVIMIPDGKKGLDEKRESKVFEVLPPMTVENVGAICRLVLMRLLPSLVERDCREFGAALTGIQNIIGEYFAPFQGGSFSSPVSRGVAELCLREGAFAASQSSWGPAVYAFVEGREAAEKLACKVKSFLKVNGAGTVIINRPNNHGAKIINTRGCPV